MDINKEINDIFSDALKNDSADAFRLTTDLDAEWAYKKIKEAKSEYDTMKAHYESQLSKIKERVDGETAYFTGLLSDYFRTVPVRSTKTGIKKYALPSCELVMKPAGIDYKHDDALLLDWCKTHAPDLVATVEKPMWSGIKKRYVLGTGEIPDGVTLEEKPESFEIVDAKE